MDNTAKLSDIISALQTMEGINQKADLKSVLVNKGVNALDTDDMATLIGYVSNNMYASNIKSIQSGSVSYTNTTSLDVTISQVDLTKAIVLVQVGEEASGNWIDSRSLVAGKLTSSTNLNLSTYAILATVQSIRWTVIEFNNVKSLQRGSYAWTTTTGTPATQKTVTISPIGSKAVVFTSFKSQNSAGGQYGYSTCILSYLLNSTTLALERVDYTAVIEWQVIEFN